MGELRESGFTLIEVMIVCAIIAIIGGMAVPNLVSSSIAANESAVASTMRSIVTAEFRFKAMQVLDRDHSGSFEYASLPELAGTAPVRETGEMLQPSLLSASFGVLDANGFATRQGYHYAVYLPDAAGAGVVAAGAALGSVDPAQAEYAWTLLAWPTSHGHTGRTTFFVDQQGQIMKCTAADYSGSTSIPPAGAALVGVGSAGQIVGGRLAVGQVAVDGNIWITLR